VLKIAEECNEEDSHESSSSSHFGAATHVSNISPGPQVHLSSSVDFRKATKKHDSAPEGYALRRRIDTEQRVGMDISVTGVEPNFSSHLSSRSDSSEERGSSIGLAVARSAITGLAIAKPAATKHTVSWLDAVIEGKQPDLSIISRQVRFATSDQLREKLWNLGLFKFWVALNYVGLCFVFSWYGI
jgi:hypothetical protein